MQEFEASKRYLPSIFCVKIEFRLFFVCIIVQMSSFSSSLCLSLSNLTWFYQGNTRKALIL